MTEVVIQRGRTRRNHSEQLKQELVEQCVKPGMSLANIAQQHGLHPNLLSRWVKERSEPCITAVSQSSPLPPFIPIRVDSSEHREPLQAVALFSKIEVNIDRGDLRIAFKVDPSQMAELGQVLREVLR